MEQRGKVNAFVDRRFGEDDASLSKEDKLLMRYQKERQGRVAETSLYGLGVPGGTYGGEAEDGGAELERRAARMNSDDESGSDMDVLTHGGRAIGSTLLGGDVELTLDNVAAFREGKEAELRDMLGFDLFGFEEGEEEGDEKEFGGLVKASVSKYDAFEKRQATIREAAARKEAEDAASGRVKTKREVYAELIAKSKLYKHEKAQLKALQEELTTSLDRDFDREVSALLQRAPKKKSKLSLEERKAHGDLPKTEYDSLLADLAKDERIRASDKLKTPEELARIERERLEKLEAQRVARMNGDGEMEEEKEGRKPAVQLTGADVIQEGAMFAFELEEGGMLAGGGGEEDGFQAMQTVGVTPAELAAMTPGERRDIQRAERKALKKEKSRLKMGEEKYRAQLEAMHASARARTAAKLEASGEAKLSVRRAGPSALSGQVGQDLEEAEDKSMPYVFPLPEDVGTLASLLEPYSVSDKKIALARLRKCFPPELGDESASAQAKIVSLLFEYFGMVAEASGWTAEGAEELDMLQSVIHEMGLASPPVVGALGVDLVRSLQARLGEDPNGFLPLSSLLMIRLLGNVFSVSDARHAVTTPLTVFMAQVLSTTPLASSAHVASSLFLAALVHAYLLPSGRYMPEVVGFLSGVLAALVGLTPPSNVTPPSVQRSTSVLCPNGAKTEFPAEVEGGEELDLSAALGATGPVDPEMAVRLVRAGLGVAASFATLYMGYEMFAEMFAPLMPVLVAVGERMPSLAEVAAPIREHIRIVSEGMTKRRRPLTLLARKAASIAMYNPRFEEEYAPNKSYDPDRTRAELRKMKREIKAARKGAIRELRKDNYFIERKNMKKRQREDEEYNAKIKGIYATLEADQAVFNAEDRVREREKKKSKRR